MLLHNTMKLIRFLFCLALCSGLGLAQATKAPYFKGVTYFGQASPTTFWNSNVQRATDDFKEIKADGFNTVVLVVPWGEFQPGVSPVRFNEDAYNRLNKVCETAKAQGLHVFVRTSYLWDYYPDVQMPNFQRANALLSSDTLMPAWKQYLQKIRTATAQCSQAYFIAWEDFWFMMEVVTFDAKASDIANRARRVSFDQWARKHAPKPFLKQYAAQAAANGLYPIPKRDSPDYRYVLEWFDDQFVRRLVPTMAAILPGTSMEVRTDQDPIYQGNKRIDWFSHHRTYAIPSSPYVMTYWAPAIGAENRSDFQPADQVLDRFVYIQKKIAAQTSNKIFIEQFLFKDNTPEAAHNTQIDPAQINTFLQKAAKPLLTLTAGYALWGARNYHANLLFNGFFSLDTLGWNVSPGADTVPTASGKAVRLQAGASVSQRVPVLRGNSPGQTKATTLRLTATGPGRLEVRFAGGTASTDLPAGTSTVSLQLPLATADTDLVLSSTTATIDLTDVYLYFFTHQTDVRDAQGKPSTYLEPIRALNSALSAGADFPVRLAADDNSLSKASGVFNREQDGTRWYAWVSDQVEAKLNAKGDKVTIKGYIKPSLFKGAKDCTLNVHIDGVKKTAQTYTADGPIELSVPLTADTKGTLIDLKLASTCSLKAYGGIQGSDKRNLAFVLSEVNSGTSAAK